MSAPLLEISGVHKEFKSPTGVVTALDDVSCSVPAGGVLGIIGESGSGKTTLGRVAAGLMPADSGTVRLDGTDLAALPHREWRRLRASIGVVFQEPFASLDPRRTALESVLEPLQVQQPGRAARRQRLDAARHALERVGLGPELHSRYPAQLSGGQQQRVGIARAIVTRPKLVLLDEPTSALDRSIRGDVLRLLGELQREEGLTYLLISHDVETVQHLADRVMVMYRGQVVEEGPAGAVLGEPQHPYTQTLLNARLPLDPYADLPALPVVGERPPGRSECRYFARCHLATDACTGVPVPLGGPETHHIRCVRTTVRASTEPRDEADD
jgi:oligopeptide/dipeptide ABC transporter ATP-binding protein